MDKYYLKADWQEQEQEVSREAYGRAVTDLGVEHQFGVLPPVWSVRGVSGRISFAIPKTINPIQKWHLDGMRLVHMNNLVGCKVAQSLEENTHLWRAAIMISAQHSLFNLDEIEHGETNSDTLFVLPVSGHEDELIALAQDWGADEIDWHSGKDVFYQNALAKHDNLKTIDIVWDRAPSEEILRVWWD